MKTKYIISSLCLLFFIVGCSTKKNTALRRNYHAMTTKYNVYFNADESYKKGYKKIEEAYKPDYSNIIEMYSVSNGATKGVAVSDMKRTQEKCEKAVKEHSIKKKPKKKFEKMRDPKYVSFYNQEEFNPKMDDVWMLFAKAKYYSNDYLAASAMFTYVTKHFSEDKALVAEAMIWKARSLKEMEWFYEADDMLKKVDDSVFDERLNNLYAGAYADLLIAQHEYKEALPYLETAIATEKNRKTRLRFTFIAGQLYQELGDKAKAYEKFEEVLSHNTSCEMEFNSIIRQTEVYSGGESTDLIKSLEKMAKKSKNSDYLDQIYYAIGNIYLAKADTTKAIENYILSAEKSTRNGLEKAQTLISLGDIYYTQKNYLKAQPCYSEASSLIDQKHDDYIRVSRLSQILNELARDYETVTLQDSLQVLALAPKETRMAAINAAIKKINDEELAQRKREEEERLAQKRLDIEIENVAVMNRNALGVNDRNTWYFANKATVDKGKLEFQRKFGKRKLEDDWNRKNKAIAIFSEEAMADAQKNQMTPDSLQGDDQDQNKTQIAAENDPKRSEYYLRQMPFTPEQVQASNVQIADALFNMAMLYDEKLMDYPQAIKTFEEFTRRFPQDRRVVDAYFYCYRINEKIGNLEASNDYRMRIINQYPDTKYAKILSNPDYKRTLELMIAEQDSLYERTYAAYLNGNFATVNTNTAYMEKNYPVSALMPKFLLLRSLGIGKTSDRDSFAVALKSLVEHYPTSDVSSMAKDILALMNQGNNPATGTPGGLMALRDKNVQQDATENGVGERRFKTNTNIPYLFKLTTDPAEVEANRLLYVTAMYNFTKFLVKDFDLSVRQGVLTVSGLDNLEEALWYQKGIFEDDGVKKLLYGKKYDSYVIAVENEELIGTKFTMDDYKAFYRDSITVGERKRSASKGAKVELVDIEKKALDSIAASNTSLSNVKAGDDLINAKPTAPSANPVAPATEVKPAEKPAETPAPEAKAGEAPQPQTPQPDKPAAPKNLKKYKGLYTYDEEAPHYFVILVVKGSADANAVKTTIDSYNAASQSLLNLNTQVESAKAFPQMFVVGSIPSAALANSYLMQVVKSADIKTALKGVEYRNIVISKDNLDVLKESGNITVYMELFKRLYLGR
ncbi:MAG TPA: tetratricopeptide repeat protein [Paludibacteraceae bacterium]|nr:tetratricopeptide repeat protein [Paludibacteraceae bacterium]HQF50451.1 tetratricopeptide repeat protein [Paludibacteraceae bacterium]